MGYKDPKKQREYQREWVRKNRAAWIEANGPCVRCGSLGRLEVDHVDPSVKVSHSVWSWAKERRNAELSKCQVLCHDCHLAKTIAWRNDRVKHGSLTMYYRGCRCDECAECKRKHNARRTYDSNQKKTVWLG